jgi:hypothetical protein
VMMTAVRSSSDAKFSRKNRKRAATTIRIMPFVVHKSHPILFAGPPMGGRQKAKIDSLSRPFALVDTTMVGTNAGTICVMIRLDE